MNLNLSLERAASLYADHIAIVDGKKAITYKDLYELVSALASGLREKGITRGDVVACLAPNCHEYLVLYYACSMLGAILNPLNFRLSAKEVLDITRHSNTSILVAHPDFASTVSEMVSLGFTTQFTIWLGRPTAPTLALLPSSKYEQFLVQHLGQAVESPFMAPTDLAQLYYTSGTTGEAKGVMLTHENVTHNAIGAVAELKLTDNDTWLHVAPMFHLVDAWAIWAITMVGGRHVFLPYFKDKQVLAILAKENITITALVPTMLASLLKAPELKNHQYSNLRMIMTAGSPVAPELVRQTMDQFGCDYVQFYGMTETSPFLTVSIPLESQKNWPPEKLLAIKASTGRPFIGAIVKVVREDLSEVTPNGKEVGEVIASGPNITRGYWKNPETTAATIKNGWIFTGDLAVVDKHGFINVVDRKKDMIITGGENVYSTEVEYVIYEHPGVLECAVIGVPDSYWGEIVKAVIVTKPGYKISEEEITELVRSKLAGYKMPRLIEFVAELPKTGSGKIAKRMLKATQVKAAKTRK